MKQAEAAELRALHRALAQAESTAAEIRAAIAAVQRRLGGDERPDHPDLTDPDLISPAAAAERMACDADTIRRWARTARLGVKRGGRWMISARRLHQFAESRRDG